MNYSNCEVEVDSEREMEQEIDTLKQEILDLAPDLADDDVLSSSRTAEHRDFLQKVLKKAHFASLLHQVFASIDHDPYFIRDNLEIINWLWDYVQIYHLWLPIKIICKLFIKFGKNI